MFCRNCGNEISEEAVICVKCGVMSKPLQDQNAKSRTTYILLGALLGLICLPGIHNLYAGYTTKGLIQLLGALFTCGFLWLPMYIWTIVEVCCVSSDGKGVPFR